MDCVMLITSLMIGHSRFPHFPNSISYLLSIMFHLFTVTYHLICTCTWVKKKKKNVVIYLANGIAPSYVPKLDLCFIDT